MGSRFFLLTLFPPLSLDAPPEMSFHEADFFLRQNLSNREMATIYQLYALYDLENIRSFFLDLPMTAPGAIPHDDLRDHLENDECPLPMLERFFATYPTLEEKKNHVHRLMREFFTAAPAYVHGFVKKYFRIEHGSRVLMAYLRARASRREYTVNPEELGFDPSDGKNWPEFFAPLLSLWQARHESPLDLEDGYARWKFAAVGSLCAGSPPFSIDHILAYLIQLRLVESRRELKVPADQNIVERISKAVQ